MVEVGEVDECSGCGYWMRSEGWMMVRDGWGMSDMDGCWMEYGWKMDDGWMLDGRWMMMDGDGWGRGMDVGWMVDGWWMDDRWMMMDGW